MPEIKIRVDCGGSPERPVSPVAPPGATVFLTAAAESFLSEEVFEANGRLNKCVSCNLPVKILASRRCTISYPIGTL